MRFMVAKKDNIKCFGCPATIQRGEDMVLNFIKRTDNAPTVLTYHITCFIPWVTDVFNRKWSDWKTGEGNNPPLPKRGRPIEITDPNERQLLNRLRALRTYHKKLEHITKVERINNMIAKISSP